MNLQKQMLANLPPLLQEQRKKRVHRSSRRPRTAKNNAAHAGREEAPNSQFARPPVAIKMLLCFSFAEIRCCETDGSRHKSPENGFASEPAEVRASN